MEVRRCDSCGKDIPKGTPYLRVTSEDLDVVRGIDMRAFGTYPAWPGDFCHPKCLHAFMCNYVSRL